MVTKQATAPPKLGETRQAPPSAPGLKRKNKPANSQAAPVADASDQATELARVKSKDERVSALQARAWQLGWVVHIGPSGGYLVCRWGRVHELATLVDVEAFLARVGGRHA